jgi:peptidase C25-like protein/fibronectin type III domain protein
MAGPRGRRPMHPAFLRISTVGILLGFLAAPGAGAPSDPDEGVPLHLTAPTPTLEPVDDGRRVVPRIKGFGLTSRPGEPMLPIKVVMVAIPEGAAPEIAILSERSASLGRASLAPAPRARARGLREIPPGASGRQGGGESHPSDKLPEVTPEFVQDGGIYGADREFPEAAVRLGRIGYLREQRFVEVVYVPVLYNPVRGETRYVKDVRAEMRFTSPAGGRPASVQPFRPDPYFEDTYRASLSNYEQGKRFRVRAGEARPSPQSAPVPAESLVSAGSVISLDTSIPGTSRYKLSVSRQGVYRIGYPYLQANAPDLVAVDPRTLALSAEGVEVPISIRDASGGSGEADGRFDPGDFLEFVGRPKTEPPTILNYDFPGTFPDSYQANDFSDTQIYWLIAAAPAGSHPRISSVSGSPQSPGFSTALDFEEAALWDENNVYLPLGDADPFFSVPSLLAGSIQAQRDLTLQLPSLATASATARVKVRLRGGSGLSISPDHRTQVWVNGASSSGVDFTWDGEILQEQEFTVPQSVLTDPTTIHLSLPGLAGVNVDRQYMDTVTIRYRRRFVAVSDLLFFTYPNQDVRFQISGFSGAAPTIYEVTAALAGSNEASPIHITGAAISGSPTSTYTFEVPRDGNPTAPVQRSFVVAGPGGVRLPDAMVRAAAPTLQDPQNSADYLVIAARDTVDLSPGGALKALLDHRLATQGLTSKTVFIDEIYDEFAYGLRNVNAIRTFLNYAFDNWKGPTGTALPPSFVLLVGDGSPDYKNTLNRTDWVDQVPTPMLFNLNSIIGYHSSDNWLASFRGDDQVPDVHLGRISTRSAAESAAVFDKILRYEQSPSPGLWKGHAVLTTSEGKFPGEAESFEVVQDDLAAAHFSAPPYSVPNPPLYFARPPWNTAGAPAFKSALVSELEGGAVLFSFVGHGAFETLGLDTFFTAQDARTLTNDGVLPFMVNINCLAGGFHYLLGSGSLGEAMTNNPAGGAIATFAPSGLSYFFDIGDLFNENLFGSLFGPTRERILGAAAARLRSALWGSQKIIDLQSFTFLGDPATVLATPAPAPPTGLSAAAGNGEVTLTWSPSPEPVAGYRIYRAASSPAGPYAPATCEPESATSCIDRTVLNATPYYYYAVSLDGEGFGGRASNFNTDCDAGPDCVMARPINPGPPSVPTGLTSLDPGTGGVLQISWQANPERDIQSYALYYGDRIGQYTARVSLAGTLTSTTLTGLADGTRYYMALSATNTSGHESALTPEISEVPHLIQGIAPPRAIADLKLSRAGGDLVLTWTRPTLDIYGRPTTVARYHVYRGGAPAFLPSPATRIATIPSGSTTSYVDVGAANLAGNAYYLVTAEDIYGLVSGAGRELPNGISNLAITVVSPGTVHLSWPAIGTDIQGYATIIDHYQIYMDSQPLARSALGPATLVQDNWHALSIDLSAPGAPLYFSVIAVDNRGNLSPF